MPPSDLVGFACGHFHRFVLFDMFNVLLDMSLLACLYLFIWIVYHENIFMHS